MSKNRFAKLLNSWYQKNARALPWRRTKDPYKIWISEIMLQQTTVSTVIPYYKKWVKAYPALKDVAQAQEQEILKMWQGLGYYSRARNILKSAQIIIKDYGGLIPDNDIDLKKLPGFGPYTVGAVLSIAFDKRYPIIDANVRRVVLRILAEEGVLKSAHDKKIYEFLDKEMPSKNLRTFNQALMELGALICRSNEPLCSICPVKSFCQGYKRGVQEIIPVRQKKILKEINVAVGIIEKNNKYFIQQRSDKGLLAGLWEFPGGKVEKGESFTDALKRELKEELNISVKNLKHLMNVKHFYTKYRVNLYVAQCSTEDIPQTHLNHKWLELNKLTQHPMPSGSAKILDFLLSNNKKS